LKNPDRETSQDKTSAFYVEADSWLGDFDALTMAYSEAFGAGSLQILNYENELETHGNMLPGIISLLGFKPEEFDRLDRYRLNKSFGLHVVKIGRASCRERV